MFFRKASWLKFVDERKENAYLIEIKWPHKATYKINKNFWSKPFAYFSVLNMVVSVPKAVKGNDFGLSLSPVKHCGFVVCTANQSDDLVRACSGTLV